MKAMNQLYALTDDILTPKDTILGQIYEILSSDIKFVQLRDKKSSDDELISLAKEMKKLCDKFGAKLIVNDRLSLAKQINAHGLHIGKDDISLSLARQNLPKAYIGISCYDDINLAKNAQKNGADYVAFGAMFQSQTKKTAKPIEHDIIIKAKQELSIPICVIGGINEQNIHQIKKLNPDLIALVQAIYKPNSIKNNIQNLNQN